MRCKYYVTVKRTFFIVACNMASADDSRNLNRRDSSLEVKAYLEEHFRRTRGGKTLIKHTLNYI